MTTTGAAHPAAATSVGRVWTGAGAGVVAVLLALLVGTQQSRVVPMSLGLTPAVVLGFGCLAALVLCWTAGQRLASPHRPVTALVLAALLTSVASAGALTWRSATDATVSSAMQYLVREVWLAGLVVFVLVVVRSAAGLAVVMKGVVVGATVSACVALLAVGAGTDLTGVIALPGLVDQGALLSGDLQRAGGVRPQGMAGHPLELSAVLTVALPIALGVTLAERARGTRSWPWAIATALIAVGAVATISRSAVVGGVAAVVVMAWCWPVRRLLVGVAAVVAGVALSMVLGVSLVSRLASVLIGGSDDNSLGSRASGVDYAMQILPQHWWFGQGAGTYDVAVQPVLDNQYLSRLVETGVAGLGGLLLVLVGAWVIAARARRRLVDAGRAPESELVGGVLGGLSAVLVIGLILDVPGFAQISTLQMVLVALAGVSALVARAEPGAP